MENKKLVIAIDGPAGSGKSTIAKKLAKKLNYTYIDTGAMYRSLALYALNKNIAEDDVKNLTRATRKINIELTPEGEVYLNGKNVSKEIRTEQISKLASPVSKPVPVRKIMVRKQQLLAKASKSGIVMDGRDIGTVVLKHADLKIYQTASIEERAKRRHLENLEKGNPSDLETVKEELIKRDYIDTHKKFGALKVSKDGIVLDTSTMSIDEVVDYIYNKAMELM